MNMWNCLPVWGRPVPDPSDPGARRPPPDTEWGWFLLAASLVAALVYAAVHSHLTR